MTTSLPTLPALWWAVGFCKAHYYFRNRLIHFHKIYAPCGKFPSPCRLQFEMNRGDRGNLAALIDAHTVLPEVQKMRTLLRTPHQEVSFC